MWSSMFSGTAPDVLVSPDAIVRHDVAIATVETAEEKHFVSDSVVRSNVLNEIGSNVLS